MEGSSSKWALSRKRESMFIPGTKYRITRKVDAQLPYEVYWDGRLVESHLSLKYAQESVAQHMADLTAMGFTV